MSKAAVIYWSQTGNTEAMAEAVARGAGTEAVQVSAFDMSTIGDYDGFALGCPAMGAEKLEEGEFAPFFAEAAPQLAGKKVVLFGSYGWGDGQWMRTWEEDCGNYGIVLAAPSVIANNAPDDDALAQCEALGAVLA
ncbi:MAG: flavodoxin domain-containing protein [Solobacterium sp.]|nr:flavodoxin domain-containing protein [Solobacterium sp.]